MGAKRHPRSRFGEFVLAVSSLTVLVVQVGGARLAQTGAGTSSIELPHFDRALLLEVTSETSANVSIGDVNGDGNPDIVLAKGRHWPLVDRVFLNDGHGRFPVAHNLGEVSDRSYSASLVDLDGDGDLDVVIGNDAPDPKLVYLNDGKGNFRAGSAYGHPDWPMRNGSVADLNGDGLPDIIVANRTDDSSGSNYVCLNRGKGRFDGDCVAFSHESATTITPADFNHDGFVDLAVPHREGGQSHVYLNDGKAGFSKRIPFGPPDAAIRMTQAADLNRDGLVDIVAIDERRGGFIYFNQRDGTFSDGMPLANAKLVPYALAVGDMNRDGNIDIIVGHVEAPSTIYFNDGSGRHFTAAQVGDNKGTAYGFAIGDLDKDGLPDLAVARSDAPNVVYFSSISPRKAQKGAKERERSPRCTPEPGRRAEQVKGEVIKGRPFSKSARGGWILKLVPVEHGWFLEIATSRRQNEDLSRLTPPWHFVPNAREIEAWHFRNEDNTGPNDGSVNAPQELREFIFSPQVGRGIEYNGSGTSPENVAKVQSFGRGWLHLDEFRLTPPRRGERASFEWLKFSACLTWPAG